jgi:hypothetical protein
MCKRSAVWVPLLTALVLQAGHGALAAQVAGIEEGTRIRVTALDPATGTLSRTVGTVGAAGPDTLALLVGGRDVRLTVAWENVRSLDESRGGVSRPTMVALGAGAGLVLGASLGWVMGTVIEESCRDATESTMTICIPWEATALYMAAAGAGGGAIAGLVVPRADRWWPRAVPNRLVITPVHSGRAALLATLRM